MRKFLAIPVLAFALAVSACGGPSAREKYTKAVNAKVNAAGAMIIRGAQGVDATSGQGGYQHATLVQAVALERLARDLSRIKPPGNVSGPHAELVSEINNYAREVKSTRSPQDLVANTRLAVGRLKAIITQINGSL